MIDSKLIELRDSDTFIPMIATLCRSDDEQEKWLFGRAGYGPRSGLVLFARLDGAGAANFDPDVWPRPSRTYKVAHEWVTDHWDEIESGDVVDVGYILGLRETRKVSERLGEDAPPYPPY